MKTVSQLLQAKGNQVWSVSPDTTVRDALLLMSQKNIGAVLVMDAENLLGIFSERDYARMVTPQEIPVLDTPVSQVMSTKVVCTEPDHTVEECMAVMTEKRVRHLPVIQDQRVIGIISIGDVVKSIISHQEFIIEQLEHYITGRPG